MKKMNAAVVLSALCIGPHQHADAAAPVAMAGMPPPGLYRIDMDSSMAFAGKPGQVEVATDGDSGDTTARHSAGSASSTRLFKGTAPVTQCVKSANAATLPMPPGGPLSCTGQSTTKTADGLVHTSTCPGQKIAMTIRQLDKERWEYLVDVTMLTTGAAPSMAGMTYMLKQQVQHGATAQERAQAQQQLGEMAGLQKETDAQYAQAVADMKQELSQSTDPAEKAALQAALTRLAPGNPTMTAHSRQVWTRIADSCGASK